MIHHKSGPFQDTESMWLGCVTPPLVLPLVKVVKAIKSLGIRILISIINEKEGDANPSCKQRYVKRSILNIGMENLSRLSFQWSTIRCGVCLVSHEDYADCVLVSYLEGWYDTGVRCVNPMLWDGGKFRRDDLSHWMWAVWGVVPLHDCSIGRSWYSDPRSLDYLVKLPVIFGKRILRLT